VNNEEMVTERGREGAFVQVRCANNRVGWIKEAHLHSVSARTVLTAFFLIKAKDRKFWVKLREDNSWTFSWTSNDAAACSFLREGHRLRVADYDGHAGRDSNHLAKYYVGSWGTYVQLAHSPNYYCNWEDLEEGRLKVPPKACSGSSQMKRGYYLGPKSRIADGESLVTNNTASMLDAQLQLNSSISALDLACGCDH
jgi:hypothetical protein